MAVRSSSFALREKPQVFLNFRGIDVRCHFISHLERALERDDINVFIDEDETRGRDLTFLFRRIEESKIVVVVFSRRYMESTWCLNELAKIKERVDEEKLVVIPVFFKIEPSGLKGLLDDACKEIHCHDTKVHEGDIPKWESALECIKLKMGLTLEDGSNEAHFVEKIVQKVKHTLSTLPCFEGEDPELATLSGIEHRVKQVEEKLEFDKRDDTRIVGIVGMPGIGKTTLAMEIFKKRKDFFVRSVAFTKIREKSQNFGDDRVRKMFLEDLLQDTCTNISDGTKHDALMNLLSENKVFVVLDDVSSADQIKVILGDQKWIKPGSKIVITTRDKAFIAELDQDPYVVPRLNLRDGLKYFSFYAFEDHICNSDKGDYLNMSRQFVDYARGNPFALKVLGRGLRGKYEVQWREQLDTIANKPSDMIQKLLQVSYDELTNEEKDAFLDIACFFRSEDEYYVRSLLGSGNHGSLASEINNLAIKCFITISGGRVEIDDLLHTFALGLCSLSSCGVNKMECRLWDYKEIIDALKNKMETEIVRGIALDMAEVKNMALDASVFTNMHNLRYLKLYSSTCPQECESDCKLIFPDGLLFPLKEVRYLDWLKFPLEEFPSDFNPANLVDLRLPNSKLKQVWKISKDTPRLKWLDLNNSEMLLKFSGFSNAPSLLRLNLEGCTSLECLPGEEMKTMISLEFLNLRGCTRLCHLPEINLPSLRTLILSDCSQLREFWLISENLESLFLDGTGITELSANIVKLQRLILLNLKDCKKLERLPECIGKLKTLQELILSGCSNVKSFPNIEDNMEKFRVLLLDGTSVEEVPKIFPGSNSLSFLRRLSLCRNDVIINLGSNISQLYHLKWLDLKFCTKLKSLSTLPPSLHCLDAHGCISLEAVSTPLAFLMPTEETHTMFIFTNCCKLNEAAKNDIASHIRRKCQLISDDHNGSFVFRAMIGTCYPGYEVPPWFSHQTFSSVIEPKLLPHWCDNKLLGIALCAIVSFRGYKDQNNSLAVKCTCEFKNLDESCSRFSVPVGGWFEPGNEPRTVDSDHVFIGYISWLNIKKRQEEEYKKGCVPTQAKLTFQVKGESGEEITQCEVVKCGFSLMYEPQDQVRYARL